MKTVNEPLREVQGDPERGLRVEASSVSLEGVVKSYGIGDQAPTVVDIPRLEIKAGEFVTLLGPSGCGKSTTLRMLAGLEPLSGGQIMFDDKDVTAQPAAARDVAMVFQNYALYPHFVVKRNLDYGLRKRKVPKHDREALVTSASHILRLDALLDRKPAELSGGQQQRVAVGRALVREPRLFLFDEPLSNLDAHLRQQLRREIVALHRKLGTTMVYVTHDQHEAMTMSDRIVLLSEGRVAQHGTPFEVYQTPANRFVASFMGSPAMNLLAGKFTREHPGLQVQADDGTRVALEGMATREGLTEESFTGELGVRPEHVSVTPADSGRLHGRVTMVEPTGADTFVTVDTPFGGVVARMPGDSTPVVGDEVGLTFETTRVHVFAGPDGSSIGKIDR